MGQFVEDFFQLGSLGTEQHDVTGGTVHVGQTGATQIPNVAQVAQELAVVVLTGRLSHTHGVEVSHAGEHFGLVAVTADNAAAVTEHTHDTAVLPVCFHFVVGKLKHTQKVFRAVHRDLIIKTLGVLGPIGRLLFDVGHKARPRAAFKLVQQGGCMFRHCHTSTWFVCITRSRDVPVNCGDPVRQSGGTGAKSLPVLGGSYPVSTRMLAKTSMRPPRKIGTPQGIADNGRARATDRQAATRSNHCLAHFQHNDNRGGMIYTKGA